jgi:hypothetical protein
MVNKKKICHKCQRPGVESWFYGHYLYECYGPKFPPCKMHLL